MPIAVKTRTITAPIVRNDLERRISARKDGKHPIENIVFDFNPKGNQSGTSNPYSCLYLRSFIEKLKNTPDGDGSLLDHMMILYGSGISNSQQHAGVNLPLMLVGGGAGTLKGGRHLLYKDRPSNANLLVSLMDKMGVPVEKVGGSNGKLNIDTLPEI